jgi:hypothetical protein
MIVSRLNLVCAAGHRHYAPAHIPTWWDGLAFRFEQMP